MVQVLAKPSNANGRREIFARGGEHPGVGRFGARAPEPPHRTILERLEQLDLQRRPASARSRRERSCRDGDLQQAGLGLSGVGERATLEAEELGFEQRVGNRRAVDVDERRIRARAHPVNDVRNEPFAGARFTLYQHGGQASRSRGRSREEARELFPNGGQCRACSKESCRRARAYPIEHRADPA